MKFTKMQGIGNDYIYVDCFKDQVARPDQVARMVSDRRFGIGGDGLILICPSKLADCRMEMYNADGSQGAMCGNGIRCVGKYVYDHGLVPQERDTITVETASGLRTLAVHKEWEGGAWKALALTVDMGEPKLTSALPEPILVADRQLEFIGVSVGNPHAVYFTDQVEALDLEHLGPHFENHPRFQPERVNSEFVQVLDRTHIRMRVWERGSGETWACGTGASASVYACVLTGRTEDEVTVKLTGGELLIRYDRGKGHLFMTGPAVEVFTGNIDIPENLYYDYE